MVALINADMVIHAGDFGFYDEQSICRLSPRELCLLVSHSPVWRQCEVDKQTNRERLIEIVKENRLLGDFPDYLSGKKMFSVPVYAVWGNHEDVQVLRQLNTCPTTISKNFRKTIRITLNDTAKLIKEFYQK